MSDCSTEAFKANEPHARMTKTKSQLRAEAVERLRDCRYHTHADYVRAMLGWGHEPHFEDSRDALIDLLTDEEPRKFGVTAEQMAKASADFFDKLPRVLVKKADSSQDSRENLGSNLGSGSEVGSEVDSREKLEADVRSWFADDWYDDYYSEEDMDSVVSEWLDRQAAITEMEMQAKLGKEGL